MSNLKKSIRLEYTLKDVFEALKDIENHKNFLNLCRESIIKSRVDRKNETFIKCHYLFTKKKYGIRLKVSCESRFDNSNNSAHLYITHEDGSYCHIDINLTKESEEKTLFELFCKYKLKGLKNKILFTKPLAKMVLSKQIQSFISYLEKQGKGIQISQQEDEEDYRLKVLENLPKNSVGAELGVYLGGFAEQIIDAVKPKKLYLVDPWLALEKNDYSESWYEATNQEYMDSLHDIVLKKFKKEVKKDSVEIHRKKSVDFLKSIPDESLDWVYIDADHSYEAVKDDLIASYDKVKVGGYIAGDDYKNAGWWGDSIIRAVDEFIKEYPVKIHHTEGDQFMLVKVK